MESILGTPVVMTTVQTKPVWQSWTVAFNMLAAIAALLDTVTQQHFGFTTSPIFLGIVAVVNVLLRFKTILPVSITGGDTVDVPTQS